MYAYILLDRLHSRYKPAILALKAGGQMKDASVIAWDTVTAFINAHERSEQRSADADVAASAKAMAAVGRATPNVRQSWSNVASSSSTSTTPGPSAIHNVTGSSSSGGTRTPTGRYESSMANIQCFHCQQFGHMKNACPKSPNAGSQRHLTGRRHSGGARSHSPSGGNLNDRSPSRQSAANPQRPSQGQVSFESSKRPPTFGNASAAISCSNPYASLRRSDDVVEDSEVIVPGLAPKQLKSILKTPSQPSLALAVGSREIIP